MPKEWEIDLGLPDIGGMFVLFTVCVVSGLLLFCCAYGVNTLVQSSGGSSPLLNNLAHMPINACLSLIEISALLVAAAISFTYLLRFLPHGTAKSKSSSTKTNLSVNALLLASIVFEIAFATIIAHASGTELKYLIFLPLTFLAIAILIFLIAVVLAVREIFISTAREKRALSTYKLIKLFLVGVMSGGLFIIALIISASTIYKV